MVEDTQSSDGIHCIGFCCVGTLEVDHGGTTMFITSGSTMCTIVAKYNSDLVTFSVTRCAVDSKSHSVMNPHAVGLSTLFAQFPAEFVKFMCVWLGASLCATVLEKCPTVIYSIA